jgi:hypothetical protein
MSLSIVTFVKAGHEVLLHFNELPDIEARGCVTPTDTMDVPA